MADCKLTKSPPDWRWNGLLITLTGTLVLAAIVMLIPENRGRTLSKYEWSVQSATSYPAERNASFSFDSQSAIPLAKRLDMHYQRSVVMLHAKEYAHALVELNKVLEIAPKMPEAYVNMGFALLGLQRFRDAEQAFMVAIDFRPEQANAYYGLAISLEEQDDIQGALGAMRTYLHRTSGKGRYPTKARAAIWEWEDALRKAGSPAKSIGALSNSGQTNHVNDGDSG